MPASIIVGAQWGDEGKGKATDLLADRTDMVVRYQGGNHACHTIVVGDEVLKLHLIPSGILYPHVVPVIAAGVVIDPKVLLEELGAKDDIKNSARQTPEQMHFKRAASMASGLADYLRARRADINANKKPWE